MIWRLRQFFAIAKLAALEAIRQPIFLLVSTTCFLFIALLPMLVTHTLGETGKLVRDSSLALHFVCGLILGSYAACSSLTHEIRRGTVSSVLSKPVGRGLFFLAKFSGIAFVMLAFSLGATLATILSARTAAPLYSLDWWSGVPLLAAAPLAYLVAGVWNFVTRTPFISRAFVLLLLAVFLAFVFAGFVDDEGHRTSFGSLFTWKLVPAGILLSLAILLLTGIAVSLAIKLDVVPTLSICSVLFLVGLMSDYLFGRHAGSNRLAGFLYLILPNWQHFWITDALSGQGTLPWSYVGQAAIYAALYLAGVLALGMVFFRNVEVRS